MALTTIQRGVCRLLADRRIASGESYVAGGAALNELLSTSRLSRDLDLFHDTEEALAATWESDRRVLEAGGYALRVLRERPTFVEAEAVRGGDSRSATWPGRPAARTSGSARRRSSNTQPVPPTTRQPSCRDSPSRGRLRTAARWRRAGEANWTRPGT
jgi:hypothetical protein